MVTALVVVDAQLNMLEGDFPVVGADDLRKILADLLSAARAAGVPIVQVQNDGPAGSVDEPHTEGWELVFPAQPGELTVHKDIFDTFTANPDLPAKLRDLGVERVVLAGMQTEYCIRSSSRGALAAGFDVVLPSGAHATYDDGQPAAEIIQGVEAELRSAGVSVVPLSEVSFR